MRPRGALKSLSGLADASGVLPPWNRWWTQDIDQLFPTQETQRACAAEMRCLPLSYFEDSIDATGVDELRSADLAFGSEYGAEQRRAAAAGWPAVTVHGAGHLHMLIDPEGVAKHIASLLAGIGIESNP